jgi:two-component system, response regulator
MGGAMDRAFVLLVDDNPDDVALMQRVFARAGVLGPDEVVVARDGVQALDFMLSTGEHAGRDPHFMPRVIFLDLKMPRVDGLEVLRRLRAEERTKLVPVVILTSSDESRDVMQSYRLGANSYIRKPEDSTQFSEAVASLGRYWFRLNRVPAEPASA